MLPKIALPAVSQPGQNNLRQQSSIALPLKRGGNVGLDCLLPLTERSQFNGIGLCVGFVVLHPCKLAEE